MVLKEEQEPDKSHALPEQAEPVGRLTSIGLPVALSIFIGIALILTIISIGLYYSSNLSRIDLSKPKYADIRSDVLTGKESKPSNKIDTTSPITSESAQRALSDMKQRRKDLQQLGSFDSQILDDAQLGIGIKQQLVF